MKKFVRVDVVQDRQAGILEARRKVWEIRRPRGQTYRDQALAKFESGNLAEFKKHEAPIYLRISGLIPHCSPKSARALSRK